jgi:RNA-directed DNA polymerase
VIVIYIYKKHFFINKILGTKSKTIYDIVLEKEDHYFDKQIKKKNGNRELKCLKQGDFKNIQSNLKKNFLDTLPLPENVYGFIKSSSYKQFLIPHIGKEFFLRIDIKNFFPSINKKMIFDAFKDYFKVEESEVLDLFIDIVTLDGKLPQGAITSPTVSNIVFRPLDIRIKNYCEKFGITYTRYADDLLFSSSNSKLHENFFIKKIYYIINDKNFKINSNKLIKSKFEISLNGFVIGKQIRLSRKRTKDIAQVVKICRDKKATESFDKLLERLNKLNLRYRKEIILGSGDSVYFTSKESLANYLLGFRSFFIDWLKTGMISNDKSQRFFIRQIEVFLEKEY